VLYPIEEEPMNQFTKRHADQVNGVLSGFDRVRLRGTLRWLASVRGMMNYLSVVSMKLVEFKEYAQHCTATIRSATAELARAGGRPLHYLRGSSVRKEELAREIAARDRIESGLICVLTCVEPCYSYELRRNPQKQRLELEYGPSKCRHDYFYVQDPQLGLIHLRLQTWLPFTLHVCLNGREWLARQMTAAGLGFHQQENCFVEVEDFERAQGLFDQQLRINWKTLMNRLRKTYHPTHEKLLAKHPIPYYWSVDESEWATDVVFRSPAVLAKTYPHLVRQAMLDVSSVDVMRFLGRRTPKSGGVNGNFQGEVVTDVKTRVEGTRVKHRLKHNAIKMYDKQARVLRVETTINDAHDLKVYRQAEGRPDSVRRWRPLRKAVADLYRRAKLSQAANDRYFEKLAAAESDQPLGELTAKLCQPVQWQGRRVRGLSPLATDDNRLLQAISRGEFAITGFRNRDLRAILHGDAADAAEARRQASRVTRQLRLLRAHGLVQKITKTHRYQLTPHGQLVIAALLQAQQASPAKLKQLVA
jgi:hypothetical protein